MNMILSKVKSNLLAMMAAVILALSLAPTWSYAAIISKTGKIVQTLDTSGATFGGCMIKLDSRFGQTCTFFASFSCTGDFMAKDVALRMYDKALMAFALDRPVRIYVDDTKQHNGHCVVDRLDVFPPTP